METTIEGDDNKELQTPRGNLKDDTKPDAIVINNEFIDILKHYQKDYLNFMADKPERWVILVKKPLECVGVSSTSMLKKMYAHVHEKYDRATYIGYKDDKGNCIPNADVEMMP